MLPTSLLATQFLEKLNEVDDFEKQLLFAYRVFKFPDLPLARKEELIFNWFVNAVKSNTNTSSKKLKELFKFLKKCLACSQIQFDQIDIRPSVCDGLLEVVNSSIFYGDTSADRATAQDCVQLMLKSPVFVRHFKQDVAALSKLISVYFKSVMASDDAGDCLTVVKSVVEIHQQTLLKNDFQLLFVKRVMAAMVSAMLVLDEDVDSDLEKNVYKCICQILFNSSSAEMYSMGIMNIKSGKDSKDQGTVIMQGILKLPKKTSCEIVNYLYPRIFSGFAKYVKEENLIFEMFTVLCTVIGFRPVSECVSDMVKQVKNFDGTNAIVEMINLARKLNISLDAEVNGVYFSTWLISLLNSLSEDETLTINRLNIIKEIFFLLDPILVEQMLGYFVCNVMLKNKSTENMREVYCETLNEILRVFGRLSRMHKFVAKMLDEIVQNIGKNDNMDLTLEEVLPKKFCKQFSEAIMTQQTASSFHIITSLRYYLEKVLLPKSESSGFIECKGDIILVEAVFELTSDVLSSTYIADHTVPNAAKEKFLDIFEHLAEFLQRFGRALLRHTFNMRATKAFFDLCYSWGSLNLLLLTYSYEPKELIQEQTNDNATNLAYILHFLPDDLWDLLANRAIRSGNDDIKHSLFKLMEQKIGALRDKEAGYNGPASKTASFLIEHADSDWICDHANSLLLFLDPKELLNLATRLSECKQQHKLSKLFQTEDFQESRDMVAAMSLSLLSQIGRKCNKSGQKLLKDVLVDLDLGVILEDEADQVVSEEIDKIIEELATTLTRGIRDAKSSKKCPISPVIERKLELLQVLPLSYLQSHTQVIILLVLFAAAKCLSLSTILYDIITSIVDNEYPVQMPGTICWPSLLKWVVSDSKEYAHKDVLIECLVRSAFRCTSLIPSIVKEVSTSKEEDLIISTVISRILPKIVRKKRDVNGDLKDSLQNCERALQKQLAHVVDLEPALCWLPTFRMAIHYYLKSVSNDKIVIVDHTNLMKLIPPYIQIAVNQVVSKDTDEDLEEEGAFLELILQNRKQLHYDLPENVMESFWTEMAGCLPTHNLQTFLQAATNEQFNSILESLKHLTTDLLNNHESGNKVFLLWRVLITAQLSNEKEGVRNHALNHLSDALLQLTFEWNKLGKVLNVHTLLTTLVTSVKVKMTSEHVGMCFEVVSATPHDADPKLLNKTTDLLSNLLRYRTSIVLDHIPQFLQQMMHIVSIISEASHLTSMKYPASELVTVAFAIEKLANVVTEYKKDFTRISQFAVAKLLHNLTGWTIEYSVKVHLKNALFSFLSLCDHHAISYLMRHLAPTSQFMFKDLHESYIKYHKFTGKV